MDPTIIPFDFQRMFLGDASLLFLLEIVFRTVIMYGYMLLATRYIGKRSMGLITPFEFMLVILLGSASGDAMFYADVPIIHALLVITVVVLLQKVLNLLTNKSKRVEEIIENKPILLVENGKIIGKALKDEQMSADEVHMELRMHGIRNVGEVEKAYLEPSGKVSVFCYPKELEKKTESTLPK